MAIGAPTFGTAAGAGLVIGAVVGGGVGAGVASTIFMESYKYAKNSQQKKISDQETKLYYAGLLARIPPIRKHLMNWARKHIHCRTVVVGLRGEGVSTVSAVLTNQKRRECGSRLYRQGIEYNKANLLAHDFPTFPKDIDMSLVRELNYFLQDNNANLLIFCVQITGSKENFIHSPHMKYLDRLFEINKSIFSNIIIALTHANTLQENYKGTDFLRFFKNEISSWKEHINSALKVHINPDISVPVIPIGNCQEDDSQTTDSGKLHNLKNTSAFK